MGRCWQALLDLNQGMSESKSDALATSPRAYVKTRYYSSRAFLLSLYDPMIPTIDNVNIVPAVRNTTNQSLTLNRAASSIIRENIITF